MILWRDWCKATGRSTFVIHDAFTPENENRIRSTPEELWRQGFKLAALHLKNWHPNLPKREYYIVDMKVLDNAPRFNTYYQAHAGTIATMKAA